MSSGSGSGNDGNNGGSGSVSGNATDPINACAAAPHDEDAHEHPRLSKEGMKHPYETPPWNAPMKHPYETPL